MTILEEIKEVIREEVVAVPLIEIEIKEEIGFSIYLYFFIYLKKKIFLNIFLE